MRPRLAPSLVLLMTFAAVSLGVAADAGACSCEALAPPAERFANAEVVFRGTVIEMDIPWFLRPSQGGELGRATSYFANWSDAEVTAVLEVHESWKGVGIREVAMDLGSGRVRDENRTLTRIAAGFAALDRILRGP